MVKTTVQEYDFVGIKVPLTQTSTSSEGRALVSLSPA
jgi:hypothetical protein